MPPFGDDWGTPMTPRTPPPHPRRWSLLDIDDPDDFYFSCADCGCTTCCIDVDTLDGQRQTERLSGARRPIARSRHQRQGS